MTDKTANAVMVGGLVVNSTRSSSILRSSVGSHVTSGHTVTRSTVVSVGSHRGRVVVRHGGILGIEQLVPKLNTT